MSIDLKNNESFTKLLKITRSLIHRISEKDNRYVGLESFYIGYDDFQPAYLALFELYKDFIVFGTTIDIPGINDLDKHKLVYYKSSNQFINPPRVDILFVEAKTHELNSSAIFQLKPLTIVCV